jgi:hypothetical protein
MSEPFLIDSFGGGLIVILLGEAQRSATLNRALEGSGGGRRAGQRGDPGL